MHLIYEALKKTNGGTDADALVASRQGHGLGEPARTDHDRSGDAGHRADRLHPTGSERVGGELVNVEFDKVEKVKDPRAAKK